MINEAMNILALVVICLIILSAILVYGIGAYTILKEMIK